MAAGLEDGEYTLGGQRVIKKGAVRLPDGTLAAAPQTFLTNSTICFTSAFLSARR